MVLLFEKKLKIEKKMAAVVKRANQGVQTKMKKNLTNSNLAAWIWGKIVELNYV